MALDLHSINSALSKTDLPPDVVQWLGRLKILLGVPFHYLVPDAQMLPMESIRFFYLDPDWMNSLVDGALSIGRSYTNLSKPSPSDYVDSANHTRLHSYANNEVPNFRRAQLMQTVTSTGPMDIPPISGFLLRSQVTDHYEGIDYIGYELEKSPYDYEQKKIDASGVQQMDTLRLEHLGNSVLIGLFVGSLYELVIHQPPEAIHFGFPTINTSSGSVIKGLRVPKDTWEAPNGYDSQSYQNQMLDNVFANRDKRVLSMAGLSKALAGKLAAAPISKAPGYYQAAPDADHKDHLISSDFALEMVQGVGLVSFINFAQS